MRLIALSMMVSIGAITVRANDPSRLQIEAAATGGFAGIQTVQVQSQPHLNCNSSNQCAVDPNNVDLVKTTSHEWKPALSTGLVFRVLIHKPTSTDTASDVENRFGIGVGAHFVFVPTQGDKVSPAPAFAVHVGKAHMQIFAGAILTPTDDIQFPGNLTRITVPATTQPSSFPVVGNGRGVNFFAGIVIGGVAVVKP